MAKSGGRGQNVEIVPNLRMSTTLSIDAIFSGQENYTLDEKGRVTVPVSWRRKDVESEELFLVPDSKGECLRAMRPDRFAQFGVDARGLPGMDDKKHRMFMRNFFAQCARTSTDKQGRIAIPKEYCERFKLKGEITLQGAGDLFEVWNKTAHAARRKQDEPDYGAVADALGL